MKLHISDITAESYEILGANLFHLASQFLVSLQDQMKLAISFTESDLGIGNATLWLTKHFSVFPTQIGDANADINFEDLFYLMQSLGPTVIVQGFMISKDELQLNYDDSTFKNHASEGKTQTENNIVSHLPTLVGAYNTETRQAIKQITNVNNFFLEKQELADKPFIYLGGFNVLQSLSSESRLPYATMLPWYLLVRDGQGNSRVYKQPELSQFLEKLPAENPSLIELETLISEMESEFDDDLD